MKSVSVNLKWLLAAGALGVALAGAAAGTYAWQKNLAAAASAPSVQYKTPQEADPYVRFVMESYDSITANYWQKVSDADMATLYQLSLQKVLGTPTVPAIDTRDRAGVAQMVARAVGAATTTEAKRTLALTEVQAAVYNLQPPGRSQLLSSVQETALRQEVSNITPGNDLYKDLGVAKDATEAEVADAYQAKAAELKNDTSPEAAAALEKAAHARDVLADTNTKALYDTSKIEPTVSKDIIGRTLYIDLSRVSPTSLQEFVWSVDKASTTPIDSMILDLRGNIGGALDFLQHFLGFFIGQNQYAFDLYRKDDYNVQRTAQPKFPELSRIKEIAILTDNMTQSTAELTAAAFKKFRLAKVVGTATRGWGTVENTYPLNTSVDPASKYALLLVNSITLRDDNQPIEGRGVTPDIDVANPNWKAQLSTQFDSQSLIKAIIAKEAK